MEIKNRPRHIEGVSHNVGDSDSPMGPAGDVAHRFFNVYLGCEPVLGYPSPCLLRSYYYGSAGQISKTLLFNLSLLTRRSFHLLKSVAADLGRLLPVASASRGAAAQRSL